MNKRVSSTFTAITECEAVAIDNNFKELLIQLYGRPITDAEYMRAYRKKANPFKIEINSKVYTIKEFAHKLEEKQNPQP